jgi:hypothetical protein
MILLPPDASPLTIGEAVLSSLRGTRENLSEQEFESEMSAFLQTIKERSWKSVYKGWNLVKVSVDPGASEAKVILAAKIKEEDGLQKPAILNTRPSWMQKRSGK